METRVTFSAKRNSVKGALERKGIPNETTGGWLKPTSSLKVLTLLFVLTTTLVPAQGDERDALQISSNIRARHMPHGTILSPIFADPISEEIVSYTRAADSAIWTGHYLAAEIFRYGTTGATEALNNATQALSGIRSLVDITGTQHPGTVPYTDQLTVRPGDYYRGGGAR